MTDVAAAQPASDPATPPAGPEITDTAPISAVPDARTPAQQSRMDRALAIMHGKKPDADPAVTLEGTAPPAPADNPEPETPAAEELPAPAPEPAKTEPEDPRIKLRLAKALEDLQKAEATKLEQEGAQKKLAADMETLRKELDKAKAEIEARDKDVNRALKAHGGFDRVAEKVLKGEIKAPTGDAALRDEFVEAKTTLEQELAALKAEREAEKAARAEEQRQAAERQQQAEIRERDLNTVKERFKSAAERFPIAATLTTPEALLDICYQHQIGDPDKALESIEQTAYQNVESLLTNAKTLTAIVKRNPKLRETILGVLGSTSKDQSRKTPSSGEGPRATAADTVSVPTTPKELTRPQRREDRMARAIARLSGGS